jgi:hypothetical protein
VVKPYFKNLNDGTNEGLIHTELPIFLCAGSTHEAAPGPNDFTFLFDRFARMLRERAPLRPAGPEKARPRFRHAQPIEAPLRRRDQWGDEGKGKVVGVLSSEFDVVVRYQGGANAGHTVKNRREGVRLPPPSVRHPAGGQSLA